MYGRHGAYLVDADGHAERRAVSQPPSALAPTPEAHHAAHHLRRLLRRLRLRLGPPSPSRHGARRRGARKRRSPARTTTSSTLLAHDSHTHERRSIKPEWRWFQVSGGPSWSQNRARSPPWIQPPTLGTLGRWFPVTRSAPYTLKPPANFARTSRKARQKSQLRSRGR